MPTVRSSRLVKCSGFNNLSLLRPSCDPLDVFKPRLEFWVSVQIESATGVCQRGGKRVRTASESLGKMKERLRTFVPCKCLILHVPMLCGALKIHDGILQKATTLFRAVQRKAYALFSLRVSQAEQTNMVFRALPYEFGEKHDCLIVVFAADSIDCIGHCHFTRIRADHMRLGVFVFGILVLPRTRKRGLNSAIVP